MTAAHTPEPWIAERHDPGHDVYEDAWTGTRTPYVTINGPHSGGPDIAWVFLYPWSAGNEKLVAAAPRNARQRAGLLEALERLVEAVANEHWDDRHIRIDAALGVARLAIHECRESDDV